MKFSDSAGSKSLDQREHNNDASAKRVVSYYQGADGAWYQVSAAPVGGVDYDYIDIDTSTPGEEVYTYKLGGSAGTTVKTITVTDDYVEFA